MTLKIKNEKVQFWLKWTLLSFGIISVSYIISLFAVLLVHGAFGFNLEEWGSYLSQTVMQVAGGAVIGLGTGIYQRLLLRKVFDVPLSWIYTLVIGFVVTELIVGVILWQMGLNRGELRFLEFRPLPETLFFGCAGLLIGFLQMAILRKHFFGSFYWILASMLGWGICILVTLISFWAFFLGALLYGVLTGATFMWVLRKKKE